jgi:hypothetical protein
MSVRAEIEEVKSETGMPTLKEAIDAKEITTIIAPASEAATAQLETTMKSNAVLGVSYQRVLESVVDSFEDDTGIDPAKSSHYTFDEVLKGFKCA